MKKDQYEKLKALRSKVENGTSTFKERNVYNIILKKETPKKKKV